MATLQGFTPSKEEGLDQKLTLHVWSRATFATRLLQSLKISKDPRIITVLSAGVHSSYKHYETDFELSRGNYSIKNAADAAGFYNDVLVDKLAEENEEVTVMHACPGFVATNWGTEMPSVLRWMIRGIQVRSVYYPQTPYTFTLTHRFSFILRNAPLHRQLVVEVAKIVPNI